MKLYAAIDLHSNNGVLVILDEKDQVIYAKRLPNELGCLNGIGTVSRSGASRGGRVDIQLVLVGRRIDGRWLRRATGKYGGRKSV